MSDFLKQTDQPLFPNILWEKPINKRTAKSLLIIGGHKHHFSQTQLIYRAVKESGIGQVKVILPDSIYKLTGQLPDCLFVTSTPAGSIAKQSIDQIMVYIKECDGVLIAGELSTNPETISVLELIISDLTKPIILGLEVIELLLFNHQLLIGANKLLLANTVTFIKLANKLSLPVKIEPNMSLMNQVNFMESLTGIIPNPIVLTSEYIIVSTGKQLSLTPLNKEISPAIHLATFATFYLQHSKTFEALTSAAHTLNQAS